MFSKLKMRTKLIIAFGTLAVFLIGGIGIASYSIAESEIVKLTKNDVKQRVSDTVKTIQVFNDFFKEHLKNDIENLSGRFKGNVKLDYKDLNTIKLRLEGSSEQKEITIPTLIINGKKMNNNSDFVNQIKKDTDDEDSIFLLTKEGLVSIATTLKDTNGSLYLGWTIPLDSPDIAAISKGKTFSEGEYLLGEWYQESLIPIMDNDGNPVGAYQINLPFLTHLGIKNYVKSQTIGKKGYFEIFTSEGLSILHPTTEGMIRDDVNHKKMTEMKNGEITGYQASSTGKTQGQLKNYTFQYIPDLDWIVTGGYFMEEFTKPVDNLRNFILMIAFLSLVIVGIIATIFTNSFSRGMTFVNKKIKNIADNTEKADLTKKIDLVFHDEIGDIVSGFNKLIGKLNNDIVLVEQASVKIKASSDQSKLLMDGSSKNLEEIKSSIKMIDTQTENSTSGIEELTSTLEEMARNIDSIMSSMVKQASSVEEGASSIEEMVRNIDNTSSMSGKTRDISTNLKQVSADGGEAVKASIRSIREVSDYSQQILKLLGLITNIAKQTNLLAMNAAIEAAHAGDAGKGFAIVADEIRRLSEDTNKNARDIGDVVSSIVAKIDDSVSLSEKAGLGLDMITTYSEQNYQIISQLNLAMAEQNSGAKEILQSTQDIVKITEEVKIAMSEQKNATDDFGDSIRNLRDMSIENKSNIDKHVANFTQLLESLEQIGKMIEENQRQANQLTSLVDRFIVRDQTDQKTGLKLIE